MIVCVCDRMFFPCLDDRLNLPLIDLTSFANMKCRINALSTFVCIIFKFMDFGMCNLTNAYHNRTKYVYNFEWIALNTCKKKQWVRKSCIENVLYTKPISIERTVKYLWNRKKNTLINASIDLCKSEREREEERNKKKLV